MPPGGVHLNMYVQGEEVYQPLLLLLGEQARAAVQGQPGFLEWIIRRDPSWDSHGKLLGIGAFEPSEAVHGHDYDPAPMLAGYPATSWRDLR